MGEEAEYTVKYIDGGGEEEEEEVVRLSCYFLSHVISSLYYVHFAGRNGSSARVRRW